MSFGDVSTERRTGDNGIRNTIRLLVGMALVAPVLYLVVYHYILSDSKKTQVIEAKQDEVAEQLGRMEQRSEEQDRQLKAFKERLGDDATLDDQSLQEMLTRLRNLESNIASRAEAIDSLNVKASELEGERARNRVRLIEAYDVGRGIETDLNGLEELVTQWNGTLTTLTTSETGRKLATRSDLVEQYAALAGLKVATFDDLDRWRKQFEALFRRIRLAHDDAKIQAVVTEEDIEALTSLKSDIATAHEHLRRQQRALRLIEATAEDLDPGQQSLADAVNERQAEQDAAYRRQVVETTAAAIQEVNDQYAEKIAAEQRHQHELLKQQELEAEQLQTQQRAEELEKIKGKRKLLEDEIAQQKLEAEYQRDLRTIESLLAPFLDNDITQPVGNNPIAKGGLARPTSLSALRGTGALDEDNDGLNFLFHVGGHPANGREKGSFPTFISLRPLGEGGEREKVRQAQQLLIKYGDLLVRDRKLSK